MSGRPPKSFYDTISRVGRLAKDGCQIGLSVLVSPGELGDINELMAVVHSEKVRRLRILPLQPDGRANALSVIWSNWPREVKVIAELMAENPLSGDFDVLSINDPFDLVDRYEDTASSCLLRTREMWSVMPNGDIYPCCFTVSTPDNYVGNLREPKIAETLRCHNALNRASRICRGLNENFWKEAKPRKVTCPIGSIDPR